MVLLHVFLTISLGAVSFGVTLEEEKEALAYLNKYHYLPRSRSRSPDMDITKGIRMFQKFFGLEVTGTLNNETIALMKKPRCGNPDVNLKTGRRKRYTLLGEDTWEKKKLTYFLQEGYNWNINTQRRILKKAFGKWIRYTQMEFELVNKPEDADIKISFGRYQHKGTSVEGTCQKDFDGWGGSLAHAFPPPEGRLHFDSSESFGDGNSIENYDFLEVATHEIGHILGLGHTNRKDSIMYPTYQGNYPVKLFPDDIKGIQFRYPKPDVTYHMGVNMQSCNEVCETIGLKCEATGHNFPLDAIDIFTRLGVHCNIGPNAEYKHPDNPGFMNSGPWMDQCIGFRNIPDTFDCAAGGNVDLQRLCPCKKPWQVLIVLGSVLGPNVAFFY